MKSPRKLTIRDIAEAAGVSPATVSLVLNGKGEISGVIALGTELTEGDIRLIQGLGLPTVFIDTFYEVVDANFVDMNNEDAVYKVLSRFQKQGFQRIGFVASHVDTTNFRLRRDAFFKNMTRLGLPVKEADILSVESTYDGAYLDTRALLSNGLELAECYFCTNDIIAYGFIRALREHGLSIPDDVSIIGFDNLPQSATMDPGLTTIDVSKRKIGYLAVTVLDDLIAAAEPQPPVKILVGADLVLRASHERAAARPARERPSKKMRLPAE